MVRGLWSDDVIDRPQLSEDERALLWATSTGVGILDKFGAALCAIERAQRETLKAQRELARADETNGRLVSELDELRAANSQEGPK